LKIRYQLRTPVSAELTRKMSATDFVARDFDYIVIGGGTAGLAVAARLSEDPEIAVGVLEAGPPGWEDADITDPTRFGSTLGSRYDWKFETTPQPGLGGRAVAWPRGKVLGGSSALNLMTWNRGSREDYDAWEKLGNRGWGWDDLLCVRLANASLDLVSCYSNS
jgi:choline dehydrogenase-like flavoprotein